MDKNVNNNDKAFAVGVSINKLGYPKPYLYGVPFGFFFFEDLFVRSPRKLLAKILVLPRYLSWVGGGGWGLSLALPAFLPSTIPFLFFTQNKEGGARAPPLDPPLTCPNS